jgi:hypothetical protein
VKENLVGFEVLTALTSGRNPALMRLVVSLNVLFLLFISVLVEMDGIELGTFQIIVLYVYFIHSIQKVMDQIVCFSPCRTLHTGFSLDLLCYPEDGGNTFLRNIGEFLQDNMMSRPRRQILRV